MDTNGKISINEYLNDKSLLEINYIPFHQKKQIVDDIISEVINSSGKIDTTLIRRISTEIFISVLTNINMGLEDENGLQGYDQLLYTDELDGLINLIGNGYFELKKILDEQISDYIRNDSNPIPVLEGILSYLQIINNKEDE